jgi:transposase
MSQAEKREAGKRLLKLTNYSNREIARRLAVSEATIRRLTDSSASDDADGPRTVTRNGTTYTMDTSNIGNL